MIVTCDPKVSMSYIYLKEPKLDDPIWMENCNLNHYFEGEFQEVPFIYDNKRIEEGLSNLTLSKKTYLHDLNVKFEEEFLNDKEKGYISGIELRLGKKELINLVEDKVFKLYETEYFGRKFLFVSLDYIDNIFDNNNIIYAANEHRDVFYIVAVEDEICYVKGILSSRPDIYDTEYLKVPRFILYED